MKGIKTPKVHGYIEDMMDDVILCQEGKKFPYKPTQQAKHIAPTPKLCKQDIIESTNQGWGWLNSKINNIVKQIPWILKFIFIRLQRESQ